MTLTVVLAILVAALTVLAAAALDALIKGYFELKRSLRSVSDEFGNILLQTPTVPGVSVIVAPADAGEASRALVRRLLNLHYGNHEVVLVLDGPSGDDLETWIEDLRLVPQDRAWPQRVPAAEVLDAYVSRDPLRLMVVHKAARGRADAFNAGVNAAQYPVIGLIGEGAEFIPELLLRLIRPLLEAWDRTVAVSGVAPPVAAGGLAGGIATLEGLRVWLARAAGCSASGHLLPTPGACVLVKRDAVVEVGGFRAGAMELFMELHAFSKAKQRGWRFALVASAVSYRPAAKTWGELGRQTDADQRVLGGALGIWPRRFAGLYCDRAMRPLMETGAWAAALGGWYTGTVPGALALLVPVVTVGGGVIHSMTAVVLREWAQPGSTAPWRLATLCLTAIAESVGYRQWRNVRLVAGYLRGCR